MQNETLSPENENISSRSLESPPTAPPRKRRRVPLACRSCRERKSRVSYLRGQSLGHAAQIFHSVMDSALAARHAWNLVSIAYMRKLLEYLEVGEE